MPRHVAIIMDGNGRWAEARGLSRSAGHEAGAHAVRRVVRHAAERGVEVLTLFAFSAQNWRRSAAEVTHLMRLFAEFLEGERDALLQSNVRFVLVGDRPSLPGGVRAAAERLEAASSGCDGMTLALAVSYGAQEDVAATARRLAERVLRGELSPQDIDVARFGAALATGALPPVELVVRTSGEQRLSNFLLYECAYAELVFSPALWPDFDAGALDAAIAEFQRRQRRFGGLPGPESEPRVGRLASGDPYTQVISRLGTGPSRGHCAPTAPPHAVSGV